MKIKMKTREEMEEYRDQNDTGGPRYVRKYGGWMYYPISYKMFGEVFDVEVNSDGSRGLDCNVRGSFYIPSIGQFIDELHFHRVIDIDMDVPDELFEI